MICLLPHVSGGVQGLQQVRRQYGDVRAPSSTYFYGLQLGEEITVDIEEGKTLYIKLINVSDADEGVRTLTFELTDTRAKWRLPMHP